MFFLQLFCVYVVLCTGDTSGTVSLYVMLHTFPVVVISQCIVCSSESIVALFVVGKHEEGVLQYVWYYGGSVPNSIEDGVFLSLGPSPW